MTGAGYRWTASFGIFLGGAATVLMGSALLTTRLPDERLASLVWFISSVVGVAASLASLFLPSDDSEGGSPLNHRGVGYVAVGLNSWPWISGAWVAWLFPFL